MSATREVPLRVTRDHKLVEEWELVLLAQGLSPTVRHSSEGLVLTVPEDQVEPAQAGLLAYEHENPKKPVEGGQPAQPPDWLTGLIVAGSLLVFFPVTTTLSPALPWFERGSANAQQILAGELWRSITALTLHADAVHVFSNAAATVLFVSVISGILGPGVGCALVLMAGAVGNIANAFFQGPSHVAVGASTAVFGALGLLAGVGFIRRSGAGRGKRARWLPFAAALALLAMLGTTGEQVDVWAHLLGLVFGFVLGSLTAIVSPTTPRPFFQWVYGSATVGVLVYSWLLALH